MNVLARIGLMGVAAHHRADVERSCHERGISALHLELESEPRREELRAIVCLVINASERSLLAVAACARARALMPLLRVGLLGARDPELEAAAARAGALCLMSPSETGAPPWDELCCLMGRAAMRTVAPQGHSGGIVVDRGGRRLYVDGEERPMSSAKFDLLCYFLDHAGQAVSARDLIREGLLLPSQGSRYKGLILELRRHLGAHRHRIRAIAGYGYRLDLDDWCLSV